MMVLELNANNVSIDNLPGVLREMVGLIGLPATLTIVQHFGGRRLYVPIVMTSEHIQARLVGFEAACKLSKEYGGMDHFDIPRAVEAIRAARNVEMASKYRQGKTLRQLAGEYVMTERSVTKILAKQGAWQDDRQSPLF